MNKLAHNDAESSKDASSSVISVSPLVLAAPGLDHDLQVRVSAPLAGTELPIILFAHGFGSSMDGYAPLVDYWAAHGFVVIQPTFLDSRTLVSHPEANHSDAMNAYLNDPKTTMIWRHRVSDMERILDQLDLIEQVVPGLKGRLDRSRIAAVGHSFGAHTVGLLLGARVITPGGYPDEDMRDTRVKAGVLLSAGGRGGDALSQFAKNHFPYLNQSYAELTTPTLVVAGGKDNSPLTVLGPEWFTDAYYESPGANGLVTLFGGEHMLGGISGYLVTETTDEDPDRVKVVQRMSYAYLRSALFPEDYAWASACNDLMEASHSLGRVDTNKCWHSISSANRAFI